MPIYDKLHSAKREIRLIELLPALSSSSPICCNISTAFLNRKDTIYEALSYCWEDDPAKMRISINRQHFEVNINLHSALRRLRRAKDSRFLWVDAICINQSDLEERKQQVAFMSDIYRKAWRVLLWLGESSWQHDEAFEFMSPENPNRFTIRTRGIVAEQEARLYMRDISSALEVVFSNSQVWSRIWIVQELKLARDVLICCGPHTLDWIELRRVRLQANEFAERSSREKERFFLPGDRRGRLFLPPIKQEFVMWGMKVRDMIWEKEAYRGDEGELYAYESISIAVESHCDWLSTDPRDMIFALLGLCKDTYGLSADYGKENSVKNVYCQYSKARMRNRKDLTMLCFDVFFPHRLGQNKFGIPSWAVDLSSHGVPSSVEEASPSEESATLMEQKPDLGLQPLLYAAAYPAKDSDRIESTDALTNSDDEFITRGVILGHIKKFGPKDPFDKAEYRAFFSQSQADTYFTGEKLSDAILRTYMQDVDNDERQESRLSTRQMREYQQAWKDLTTTVGKIQAFLRKAQPEKEAHHERRVKLSMQRALNRNQVRFCELQQDYFAMVPRGSKLGDMLFVPFGCQMPLLLRSVHKEGKERYFVIGKAYVHGFMDNEVRTLKMPSVQLTLI